MKLRSEAYRQTGVAQYLIIAEIVRDWISSGYYKRGDTIATVDELAEQFGVAKGTIQEALKELSRRDIISTSRGKRSTVKYAPEIRPFDKGVDLGTMLIIDQDGRKTRKLLSAVEVSPESQLIASFGLALPETLIEFRSLLTLDDKPIMQVKTYVPKNRDGITVETRGLDFEAALMKIIKSSEHVERRISATSANLEVSQALDLPIGTPILRYRSVLWTGNKDLDVYYEAALRSDDQEYLIGKKS